MHVIVKVNLNLVSQMLDCALCWLNKVINSTHAAGTRTGVAHPIGNKCWSQISRIKAVMD